MELLITFDNLRSSSSIPINYQYYIGTWIYKILASSDENYAAFLHDEGYKVTNGKTKKFKLVSFSNIYCPKFEMVDNFSRIKFLSPQISMRIRFKVDEGMQHFVKGLFTDQSLAIKSGYDQMAEYKVSTIEMKETAISGNKVKMRAITPIVIGRKNDKGHDDYLSPDDEGYEELFWINLWDKYRASGGVYNPEWQKMPTSLRVINRDKVKSRLIALKEGRKDMTKIKGFLYDFEIEAPSEILEASYLGGFGKECSWGFGFCDVV
jgi:CRISPR-associated endoribonuclease Cas6